ncbi:MAG: hypothetical protein ACRDYU_03895 [Actinomycetes bacterium]
MHREGRNYVEDWKTLRARSDTDRNKVDELIQSIAYEQWYGNWYGDYLPTDSTHAQLEPTGDLVVLVAFPPPPHAQGERFFTVKSILYKDELE